MDRQPAYWRNGHSAPQRSRRQATPACAGEIFAGLRETATARAASSCWELDSPVQSTPVENSPCNPECKHAARVGGRDSECLLGGKGLQLQPFPPDHADRYAYMCGRKPNRSWHGRIGRVFADRPAEKCQEIRSAEIPYSARSASAGSTEAARRAGKIGCQPDCHRQDAAIQFWLARLARYRLFPAIVCGNLAS